GILSCAGIIVGCVVLSKRPERGQWWIALAALTVLLGTGSAWTSHAAGRLGPRAVVLVLDALHQLAAGVWIGGLLHLTALASSRAESGWSPTLLQRFSTTSFVSVAVLVVAASLTSLPPAGDVVADRASLAEVGVRFAPRWPALTSPKITEMPVDDRNAPRTDADRAWSEFNHHWAGIFVLLMGLLALVHATGRARWARHWPLVFLGLAGFLLVRTDPGAWPLGPLGFWERVRCAEALQPPLFR